MCRRHANNNKTFGIRFGWWRTYSGSEQAIQQPGPLPCMPAFMHRTGFHLSRQQKEKSISAAAKRLIGHSPHNHQMFYGVHFVLTAAHTHKIHRNPIKNKTSLTPRGTPREEASQTLSIGMESYLKKHADTETELTQLFYSKEVIPMVPVTLFLGSLTVMLMVQTTLFYGGGGYNRDFDVPSHLVSVPAASTPVCGKAIRKMFTAKSPGL